MGNWITPVTNRNINSKYNTTDLNRVEENNIFLKDELFKLGYNITLNSKGNWWNWDNGLPTIDDVWEFPNATSMTKYLENITMIRDSFQVLPTTPNLPTSMDKLTFQGANAIEENQLDIYSLIQGTLNGVKRLSFTLGGRKKF